MGTKPKRIPRFGRFLGFFFHLAFQCYFVFWVFFFDLPDSSPGMRPGGAGGCSCGIGEGSSLRPGRERRGRGKGEGKGEGGERERKGKGKWEKGGRRVKRR